MTSNENNVQIYVQSVDSNGETPQAVGIVTGAPGSDPEGVMVNPAISLGTVFNPPQAFPLPPTIIASELGLAPASAPVNSPSNTQIVPNAVNVDGDAGRAPANGAPIQSPSDASFYR